MKGIWGDLMNSQLVLVNFLDDNEGFSKETIATYKIAISQFFDFSHQELNEIKKNDIIKWITYLNFNGRKPRTVQLKLAALKSFFVYCLEEGYINKNPMFSIQKPKEENDLPKYLDQKILIKLRELTKGHLRDRAILETLYCTGVRVSELCEIEINDVDFNKMHIYIKNGKGKKERYVLFNDNCKQRILEYLKTRKNASPYLFISENFNKGYLTRQGVWKILKGYTKKIYIDQSISPHTLRHTFATHLAEKGAGILFIKELMGHEDPRSTAIYRKLSKNVLRKKYDEYN